ncbi:biogenesis of lysosome-related organelles complex 1 subunit 1 [Silene latifolia]|uniref:biogenesis of lysosome-related organelles complex 1 subunit 1 n=1 Tax=Silene latifolia TaxID=37657 RepID=UPI003D78675A
MSSTAVMGRGVASTQRKEGIDGLEASLADMLHQHNISAASLRHQTEMAKKEAIRAGTRVSEVLVEAVNGGVEECFLNEKQIEMEIRSLSVSVARFHKQTHQWLTASRALNDAVKEIGDFENWINVMLFDCHNITAAIRNIHQS